MSKKQMGFTLIEIVMVLVLLGILSAVAVPKYFDLRDKAEEKAAAAIAAEVQARINGGFADAILNGTTVKSGSTESTSFKCKDAQSAAFAEGKNAITEAGKSDESSLKIGDFTVTYPAAAPTDEATFALSIAGNKTYTFKIAIPQCK